MAFTTISFRLRFEKGVAIVRDAFSAVDINVVWPIPSAEEMLVYDVGHLLCDLSICWDKSVTSSVFTGSSATSAMSSSEIPRKPITAVSCLFITFTVVINWSIVCCCDWVSLFSATASHESSSALPSAFSCNRLLPPSFWEQLFAFFAFLERVLTAENKPVASCRHQLCPESGCAVRLRTVDARARFTRGPDMFLSSTSSTICTLTARPWSHSQTSFCARAFTAWLL